MLWVDWRVEMVVEAEVEEALSRGMIMRVELAPTGRSLKKSDVGELGSRTQAMHLWLERER
jgi:hypothetical protein